MKHLTALKYFTFLIILTLFASCAKKEFHIYSDTAYSQRVEKKFSERKAMALKRDSALFNVFNLNLTQAEQEGLKFLYAYMPLSDLADYQGEFFLNQVRWSLAARDTFTWGKTIPEDVFRHFVLPYRVNNENLDTARIVFFNELKDRIKNLPILDAALEVNHWCHEKVTYKGSDGRTSAPLASLKTAYGRCGEESTFTVTALRAVAIPARQVYTPRWAHSDDNHAWVEFWADGKWHYLGACEPDCIPDRGWFTEPARRAMLIHTKAFGDYQGGERAENRETNYALLNTLSTYAPTKEIHVQVINTDANPEKNATVEFQLYNYAEFYPISVKKADEKGQCSFLTGFGDLVVWARTDDRFGFKKITVADTDTLTITLDQQPYTALNLEYDLVPPIQREPLVVTDDCADKNNRMLQHEDSIRGAYESTFRTEEQARAFAAALNLDPDKTWKFISRSRGNYEEIEAFLKSADPVQRPTALELLSLISDKDLRDTKAKILLDHLRSASIPTNAPSSVTPAKAGAVIPAKAPSSVIPAKAGTSSLTSNLTSTILNPRIANEMLVAYREFLSKQFGSAFIDEVRQEPANLTNWIRQEIKMVTTENYYNTPLTPVGVYNLRVADEDSRKIFTVACYRTFGIPSRLKPGTLEAEYWFRNQWNLADFGNSGVTAQTNATLILKSDPANPVQPQYETHYTLARFAGGKYNTLAYGYDNFGDPLAGPLTLPQGHYLLVTGNRMPGGKVLASLSFFELKGGETKEMMISLRKSAQAPETIAKLNAVWPVNPIDRNSFDWKQTLANGTTVIGWVDPDKEPSKHIFQDLGLLKNELDKLGCPFVFLIPENKLPAGFTAATWKNLPSATRFLTIPDLTSLTELEKETGKSLSGQFPVVIMINNESNVTYLSSGYKIGIGEEIIKEAQRK
ncbi:MAG: transglutaminase-like domain-containing protein [Bacteroidales bacterium]|nr:transglutaminase-like domain-containing protein [Bacteroidales bacterium]